MIAKINGESYSIDSKLSNKWDKLKNGSLAEWDEDRFYIVDGHEGCQPKGEKILMSDGSWKNVEDIKIGDKVLSPQKDGSHIFAEVLKTSKWECDKIYDVVELNKNNKKLYSCSYNHQIPINKKVYPRINGKRETKNCYWKIENYSAERYSKLSKFSSKKNQTTLLSFPIEKFEGQKNLEIEPYTLGAFLGDGHFSSKTKKIKNKKECIRKNYRRTLKSGKVLNVSGGKVNYNLIEYRTLKNRQLGITTEDKEIIKEISKYYKFIRVATKKNNKASTYFMSVNGNLANSLSRVGLEGKGSGEKFIPKEALLSDIDYRKKLLAGLIDTDGYFNKKSNSFSIITKSERLAKDIYGLVRSLGGRGSIKEKIKRIKEINFEGTYFEVYFYLGNLKLPTKLKRKGGYTSMFYISANRCSIDVKNTNRKEYVYGFLINSKSHWYITNDYIITHNSGKSLFTIQQAAYIDPTILDDENGKILPRICFSVDEFLDAVRNTKSTKNKTKCVIFDEAFRGMSSKASLSGTNKKIVEALMEVRQNNLVVFIVSPSFYLLELYPAVLRSKALFHIVKEKGTRLRYVRIFNFEKKAKLYQIGVRKAWSYPIKTKTKVRFFNKYPGGDEFEKKYRAKKRKALTSSEDKQSKIHKWKAQRNAAIKILYDTGKSYKEISNLMEEKGNRIGITQIGSIVSEEY